MDSLNSSARSFRHTMAVEYDTYQDIDFNCDIADEDDSSQFFVTEEMLAEIKADQQEVLAANADEANSYHPDYYKIYNVRFMGKSKGLRKSRKNWGQRRYRLESKSLEFVIYPVSDTETIAFPVVNDEMRARKRAKPHHLDPDELAEVIFAHRPPHERTVDNLYKLSVANSLRLEKRRELAVNGHRNSNINPFSKTAR